MFGRLDRPSSSNSWSQKNYNPVAVTSLQKLILKIYKSLSFDRTSRVASVMEFSIWSARRCLSFLESFKKESNEVQSIPLHKEMSIDVRFLQDFPNSIMTELLIGTETNTRDLIFGARYPILLMRSLEISFLQLKSRCSSFQSMTYSKFCSFMMVLGSF